MPIGWVSLETRRCTGNCYVLWHFHFRQRANWTYWLFPYVSREREKVFDSFVSDFHKTYKVYKCKRIFYFVALFRLCYGQMARLSTGAFFVVALEFFFNIIITRFFFFYSGNSFFVSPTLIIYWQRNARLKSFDPLNKITI